MHTLSSTSHAIARNLSAIIAPEHILRLINFGDINAFSILDKLESVHVGVLFARAIRMMEIVDCENTRMRKALHLLAPHAGCIVAAVAEAESRGIFSQSPFATARHFALFFDGIDHRAFITQLAAECAWNSRVALHIFATLVRQGDSREVLANIYGNRAAQITLAVGSARVAQLSREVSGDPQTTFRLCRIDYERAMVWACNRLMREIFGLKNITT